MLYWSGYDKGEKVIRGARMGLFGFGFAERKTVSPVEEVVDFLLVGGNVLCFSPADVKSVLVVENRHRECVLRCSHFFSG